MPFNHVFQWLRKKGVWALPIFVILVMFVPGKAGAAGNDFNIQVSPSPLVVTLQPGKQQTATLTVRNATNHTETLYPKVVGFKVDKTTKNVALEDTPPAGMDQWVTFTSSVLNIAPGGTQTLDIVYHTPSNVGFSYYHAVTLSRKADAAPADGVHLQGAVAVFCLVNIDRPDAKRALTIESFKAGRSNYQYLPATFDIDIKNTGNVIAQPSGTLFIQRSFDSAKPVATLPINPGSNYILPDTTRSFETTWSSGFPLYVTNKDGERHLSWDWKRVSDLRFGRYVAKVVLVYNDGQRDVPLIASYSFWVIPWTLLLVILIVGVVLIMGLLGWGKLIVRGTKKVRGYAKRRS